MLQIKKKKKKGQSTLEYIILLTAVVIVILWFVGPNGVFRDRYNETLKAATNGMVNMAERLGGSRPKG